jgi:hypothetical protein
MRRPKSLPHHLKEKQMANLKHLQQNLEDKNQALLPSI